MTKRPQITIHMGDAKTGTTSLQTLLFDNREALRGHGVVYADSGRIVPRAIGHHQLPKSLYAEDSPADLAQSPPWADLKKEIADLPAGMRMILSSEGFSSLNSAGDAARLAAFFDGCDVSFLLCVRKPDAWIESMYQQNVKGAPFSCNPFDLFQRAFELRGYVAGGLLADAFGDASVDAMIYQGDVVGGLLARLGLAEVLGYSGGARENIRQPEILTHAFLALNHVEMPMQARRQLYRSITETVTAKSTGALSPRVAFPPLGFVDDDQRRAYLAAKRPLVQAFCNRFGLSFAELYGDDA